MADPDDSGGRPNGNDDGFAVLTTPLKVRARRGGVRLDRMLADSVGCSRRHARALIRSGRVRINGRIVLSASPALSAGDEVCVAGREPLPQAPMPPHRAYRLLWRGEDFWVLDKPAGVHTHAGRSPESVADALTREHPQLSRVGSAEREGGLVHRLDRDTSGVLLAAVHPSAYHELRAAFAARAVTKQYWAIVAGGVNEMLTIDLPLARRSTRVVPARRGDRAYPALSRVTPLETTLEWSLVEVEMCTGVTHQVRAHLAFTGHPLVGDAKYGGPATPVGTRDGQLLHARSLVLPDGRAFTAAAHEDFVRALYLLRRFGLGA